MFLFLFFLIRYAKEKKIMLLFRVKTRVVLSTVFKQNDVEQSFYFLLTMIKIGHCKTVFLIINKKPMSPYSYLLIRYAKRAKEKKKIHVAFLRENTLRRVDGVQTKLC